jgi:ubiquinone/menaquinone biosynthesis C-methylase UbiE
MNKNNSMKLIWNSLEKLWRKQLLSYARGKTLEVSVGKGVNFKYYPMSVSVTATDDSARIIELAKTEADANGVDAEFIVSDIAGLQLPSESFDTIISTFSMCHYEDPGAVLKRFNEWCKPDGIILLLEYGLSKNGVVSWLQKKWEPMYYSKTGCHLDRDTLAIIADSGLKIKRVEVKYAGTVYLVWASLVPRKAA